MPEGDTIFRAARTLHRALSGSIVTRFETQLPVLARVDSDHPIAGRTVEFARSQGKWLEIGFSGDLVLLTHMLMSGSWHIYRPGEAWQKSRYRMRVVIATASIVAVAFDVQVAEFHSAKTLARRRDLGPDVLAPDFDETAVVETLEKHPELEIGVALLTQSILAGVGNIFKSEVCSVAGVNPFEHIGALSPHQLHLLVSTARKLLLASANGSSRQTTVYRRNGEPCRKCGMPILSRKQGVDARTSFWCPACQARRRAQVS
jgi:endonuclease-8